MTINGEKNNTALTIELEGRLDTATSPMLEDYLSENLMEDILELRFDLGQLSYISSAGLRVLLSTQKKMDKRNGKMIICNVPDLIMDIFDVVGFADIFTIER